MKDLWITPDLIFDGQTVVAGQSVRVEDDRITEIAPIRKGAVAVKGCLTPGFVDLQVNGGGGVLLNTTPTVEGIAVIAEAHRRFGTVAIMPTVITDSPEVLEQAADAVMAARTMEGIIGLHIEGPHISLERRGTHKGDSVRPLDDRTMTVVAGLRGKGIPVLITVAPEAATTDQITALAATGAIVSIGHTNATAELVEAAIAAGASCATHLFNAMSPMTGRAPGAVGAVINAHIHSGIICDGHHVDDRMVQLALRARPADDLMFLVSDAMPTVGGPDHFDLYGQDVRLDGGRLVNADGNLAGAHVTQAEGVKRLVDKIGLSLEQALRMAVTVPARVVGRADLSALTGRRLSEVIMLDSDLAANTSLVDMVAALKANDAAE